MRESTYDDLEYPRLGDGIRRRVRADKGMLHVWGEVRAYPRHDELRGLQFWGLRK